MLFKTHWQNPWVVRIGCKNILNNEVYLLSLFIRGMLTTYLVMVGMVVKDQLDEIDSLWSSWFSTVTVGDPLKGQVLKNVRLMQFPFDLPQPYSELGSAARNLEIICPT